MASINALTSQIISSPPFSAAGSLNPKVIKSESLALLPLENRRLHRQEETNEIKIQNKFTFQNSLEAFDDLPFLQVKSLSLTNICFWDALEFKSFLLILKKMVNLETLKLDRIKINPNAFIPSFNDSSMLAIIKTTIPVGEEVSGLKSLELYGLTSSALPYEKLTNLVLLYIDQNSYTAGFSQAICKNINQLIALEKLMISYLDEIPKMILELSKLKELDFPFYQGMTLPKEIALMKDIQKFALDSHHGGFKLPKGFCQFSALVDAKIYNEGNLNKSLTDLMTRTLLVSKP